MKRSEAIKLLIPKVISPYEVIKKEYYDNGFYERRARDLLDFIEFNLGMSPPEHLFTSGERKDHWLQEWESEELIIYEI